MVMQLWKCNVLLKDKRKNESLNICHKLCKRTPPITDDGLVSIIQGIVRQSQQSGSCTAGPEVQALWDGAIKSTPRKKVPGVLKLMFESSVAADHWTEAQKVKDGIVQIRQQLTSLQAMMQLKKEHSEEPKYHFSYILITQVLADELRRSDPRKSDMFNNLAYALLKSAVEKSSSDPVCNWSIRNL